MSSSIRKGTVCFLRQDNQLLLVLIEYSPDDRKWTGIGGFVEEGESLEEGVVREASEETFIRLDPTKLKKVVELNGSFQMNVFVTDEWQGEIKAKESSLKEFRWFNIGELPYTQMHPGTESWMPQVLEGKLVKGIAGQVQEVSDFD